MEYEVRVGIVDIGSNTARLLVAAPAGAAGVEAVHEERALLGLGEEIERFGRISELKLAETAERARAYARIARQLGCARVEVIVTAPGRQSGNAGALVRSLERATGNAVRVLDAEEEGRLAFAGAVAQVRGLPAQVAVCDVGGGSTELVVGSSSGLPERVDSLDLGSLRLTSRLLHGDPPGKKAAARARRHVAEHFERLAAPGVRAALATGGTARSLRRLAGTRSLDETALERAIRTAVRSGSAELASEHGLDPVRARTLLGGALILAEAQRRLGVPLEVARGGLREGAAAALLAERSAA
jgi:exopolyphosphatase/guanosine-5'-triphosphate,3'-diphosphate pyrophosphatase